MREKGQTEAAKTLETPVFSRGIEILTEKINFNKNEKDRVMRLLIFDMGINYTSSVLICAAPPMIRDNLVYIL